MRILFLLPLAAALLHAEVTVNPPIPIKYRIQLRCVQVASTSGSFATVLGTEFQRDYIESQVDRVFAQMGVDVLLFPTTNVWTNNFAFDGGVGDNELRPAS